MRITRKHAPVIYDYKLMGHALESILYYPYLKIELLSTLDWSHHFDNKDNKANQTLGFLRRNLSNCPGSSKELAYKGLVRPHLEYASQVWDQWMDKHISGIEAVRQWSAQFVKDCREWTPATVTNFFNDLDWPPLQHQIIRERIPKLHQKAQSPTMILSKWQIHRTGAYRNSF